MNTWPLNGSAPMICCTLAARPSNRRADQSAGRRGSPLFPAADRSSQPPHCRQHPPQRLLVDAAIDAHSNPIRQIDLDHPDALRQGQTGAARAYRASRHWHHWALARCLGDDTNLNEFRWRDRSGSRCQTRGLPGRSPIVQKALRDPVPLGNNQNLTALGLHFSHQRRLGLRRPLPAALNHDLAIHSKHSFWTVQKDPASLRTLLSTTAGRPVQTGRLRAKDNRMGWNRVLKETRGKVGTSETEVWFLDDG